MYAIRHYTTQDNKDPFLDWLKKLRDPVAKGKIIQRVGRIEAGNFGDHKSCREGVWELRIDHGSGYRVYYSIAGQVVVLLLCGGTKGTQDLDIECAIEYWQDWKRRSK